MKIVRTKPTRKRIEEMLISSRESLYLEGIGGLSRKDISLYHAKELDEGLKDENFIIINNDDGSFAGMGAFQQLNWDTRYLRQKIAKINLIITGGNLPNQEAVYNALFNEIFSLCEEAGVKLIFFRAPVNNKLLKKVLILRGVHPLSTLVNLYYSFDPKENEKNYDERIGLEIRPPGKSEYRQLENSMADEYENRLLREPLFKSGDVKNLYRAWIKNDLNGRVEKVLAASNDGVIVGFVAFDSLPIGNKRYGFIDMLVVRRVFRRKGAGTVLLNEAAKHLCADTEGIFLGTESEKRETVNFYLNFGFRVINRNYSYHIKLGG